MDYIYNIIQEKGKQQRAEQERPYLQIPLPIPRDADQKPPKKPKNDEKRGVYIWKM